MRLAEQWRAIETGLPDGWAEARLVLRLERDGDRGRALAVLGPANPGARGGELVVRVVRGGGGVGPEGLRRLLRRLDDGRVAGGLELLGAAEAEARPERVRARPPLAEAWDAAVACLPADWSDAYVEVELRSSDHLERAALLMAPLNPLRDGHRLAFRFRVARTFGYGASPGMTRRCLVRCDEAGVGGVLRVLRALADTDPVQTQGPVWYVAGKAV